ncbi:dihydrodipicolinate synthase family protein [Bradyrhizobium sp. CCGB01]|uniref:dihydrodipicolinate synthase family protein n=1 Tax=Bradyrhizobium sp. CCGB01 TaxID=2949634 RepID=UPI0020B187C2|nr:dihydrodipicolinate synthase family protein [Bradyrhizobium sp. CCGB01]MCP3405691.1 dihydrodipicolinate synthase family protein [Bradyrhizobium sp. CCGB01]
MIAAAATPIGSRRQIDQPRLIEHCRWLLESGGCDAVNLLGTTGEATSFALQQRVEAMSHVSKAGLPMSRFMVGTGAAAVDDAIALTRAAEDMGFAGALLVPPFYCKGITEDTVVNYVQKIIDEAGLKQTRLYLYHIPQFSGVPYTIDIVERVKLKNPNVLRGVKDSSGDLAYSRELARRLPGIDVFPCSEGTLSSANEHGFAGCISATTNVSGALAQEAWRSRGTDAGRRAGDKAMAIREILSRFPLVPAVKWAVSLVHADPFWRRLQPPLASLSADQAKALEAALPELN